MENQTEEENVQSEGESKRCVIYARVSPTKHIRTASDMHKSMEQSIEMCTNDIERDSNELIEVYKDEYVSGKSSKFMPEFQRMMSDARERKFDRVYCRRVNRFGRNRNDMLTAEIELNKLDITVKFVESGIDTAKPFGRSIMAVLSELAEMDREEILANTSRGRREYKLNGGKFGRPKKEINVKNLRRLRLAPAKERMTWKELSDMFDASPATLINKLKEAGYWDEENRTVI